MASVEVHSELVTLLAFPRPSWPSEMAVRGTFSAPPGARLEAVAVDDAGARTPFRMKVHRCKRQDDGAFIVVGAAIDLRKEARTVLEGLAASAPGIPRGV